MINSDKKDVKETLAPFICHYFYRNLISPYTVEEKLIYIFSIMLKDEINKINSLEQINNFLNRTPCGYMLEELKNKSDIQTYSKTIIYKIIEELEMECSQKKLNLDIINIEQDINNIENNLKSKKQNINKLEEVIFLKKIEFSLEGNDDNLNIYKIQSQKINNHFNEKYISSLTNKELEKISEKYINNQKMYEFIIKYKNKSDKDKNEFANENLINKIFNSKYSSILFFLYQNDFLKLIKYLDLLLNSFLENIKILPKSLKYISKIILIIIQKKFPNLLKVEQNAFVSKFLFSNLFIQILKEPLNLYFNEFIISENTLFNLKYLLEIFNSLTLGNLFNQKTNQYHFTPLNWYFIEKMPVVFELFEKITDIKLPLFIEKLINDNLPKDYVYNYFKENQEQIIFHRSICFTLEEISCLIENMNNCKNILFSNLINKKENINNDNEETLFQLQTILKKLNSENSQKLIEEIRNYSEFEIIPDLKVKSPIFKNKILIYELLILLILEKHNNILKYFDVSSKLLTCIICIFNHISII